jgi:hypothetical protein
MFAKSIHEMAGGNTTRHCRRCGLDKPVAEFHRHRRDGYQAWCKPCRREYAARHYQKNKSRRQAQNNSRQIAFRAWYTSLKAGKPCADCGREFHPAAMHWDHLPGQKKKAALGVLVRHGSRKLVLEEIAKCELVCANCHAIRTFVGRDKAQLRSGKAG